MTEIGAVIQPGEAIPEDVTGFVDNEDDTWARTSRNHWHIGNNVGSCERGSCGHGGSGPGIEYFPLTVTAAREQPAEPAPYVCPQCGPTGQTADEHAVDHGAPAEDLLHHHTSGEDLTACGLDAWNDPEEENPDLWVHSTDRIGSVTCEACREALAGLQPVEPAAVDLLDLVRQYGDARWSEGTELDGGGHNWGAARLKAAQLLARIEAEVNRLHADLANEREAEERGHAELTDIVRRLDEAEVDSGGVSERVGYAIQSMQRGWATALDNLGRLDTVKADRETTRAALQHLKDTVTRPAIRALGVRHNEEIVPAIERLKDDLRAVDDLVQDDLMQRPADPLVLSLPSVPPKAIALIGDKTGHRYTRNDQWWIAAGSEADDVLYAIGDVFFIEGSVRVVMREPRTELPCGHLIDNNKFEDNDGAMVLITVDPAHDSNGEQITTPLAWCAQGHGWVSLTAEEYAEITEVGGPLVEVFDEDGTRA